MKVRRNKDKRCNHRYHGNREMWWTMRGGLSRRISVFHGFNPVQHRWEICDEGVAGLQ